MQTSGALIIIKQRLGLPIVSFQSDLNLFRRVIHALNQPRVGMSVTAIVQSWRFEIDIVNLSADRTTETAGYPLFQNLEDGVSASEFVELFPGVTLDQVRAVLEHVARSALAPA